MPEFEASVDVEIYEIIDACSRREKGELIDRLIQQCAEDADLEKALRTSLEENFPEDELVFSDTSQLAFDHETFIKSLDALRRSYYTLSNETIENINSIASRFK
jgi:hypothetical protein